MNDIWTGVITVATAIVGVAIIAVLVSNQAQTGNVITAAGNAFANDLKAATGPVSGGGNFLPTVSTNYAGPYIPGMPNLQG